MHCPHPLDPLCVAIMLRLSSDPASISALAAELDVTREIAEDRLQRLSSLGAIELDQPSGQYRLLPGAHRLVLRGVGPGLSQHGDERANQDEPGFAARLARLREHPMFRELPREELSWMARVSRTLDLSAGEILLLEGDECHGLYIVEYGTVRLSRSSSSSATGFGREQTIRLMVSGDSFNEVPVFDGGPNPVTAEATEPTQIVMVPRSEVQALVGRCPSFAHLMIGLMAGHLRHMLAMVEDISMRDVTGRVAKILLQTEQPADGVGSGVMAGHRLTQREIAEMAGTAREVVARALKKMEQSGAVRVSRGDVQILDPELLESFT